MKKRYFYLIVAVIALLLIATGCTPAEEEMPANTDTEMTEEVIEEEMVDSPSEEMAEEPEEMMEESEDMLKLTLDELAMYNGKDGQAAYVAIEGVVYDVTGIPSWLMENIMAIWQVKI